MSLATAVRSTLIPHHRSHTQRSSSRSCSPSPATTSATTSRSNSRRHCRRVSPPRDRWCGTSISLRCVVRGGHLENSSVHEVNLYKGTKVQCSIFSSEVLKGTFKPAERIIN
ncbi:hypothetical protein E2562_038459 [Oryza meyeriana var. granulata]|uniref:Uncharacterized protein n=1 Tax=Oryza meyeriana var. granulata TaxID=110450 RepID=A0A6G1EUB7_9ORYZ|nr:hypothetical protein E2562_038459 [Oryza meyeriana var. granulata]KAF0928218.1 hypothetical protein E2562_038459 [Oryza meyeriana var. granulata]KAF0928219.1 hypothetical protein E2562_038459 [Oryza meyeriana var. granulata]